MAPACDRPGCPCALPPSDAGWRLTSDALAPIAVDDGNTGGGPMLDRTLD